MICLHQYHHLEHGVFKGTALQYLVFSNGLHGKLFTSTFQFAKVDATESSLTYLHMKVEIVKGDRSHGRVALA